MTVSLRGDGESLAIASPAPTRAASRLTALYEEHAAAVFRFAYHLTGRREDAEDVTQFVFIQAFRLLEKGGELANPRAWLMRATKNRSLNLIRDRREVPTDDLRISGRADADTDLAEAEVLAEVRAALWALPENQHQAFVLRHWSGLSQNEIADVLGTTAGAVESLLVRARSALVEEASATESECRTVRGRLVAALTLNPAHAAHVSGCRKCRVAQRRLSQSAGFAATFALMPRPHVAHALASVIPGFSAPAAGAAGVGTGAGGLSAGGAGAASAPTSAGLVGSASAATQVATAAKVGLAAKVAIAAITATAAVAAVHPAARQPFTAAVGSVISDVSRAASHPPAAPRAAAAVSVSGPSSDGAPATGGPSVPPTAHGGNSNAGGKHAGANGKANASHGSAKGASPPGKTGGAQGKANGKAAGKANGKANGNGAASAKTHGNSAGKPASTGSAGKSNGKANGNAGGKANGNSGGSSATGSGTTTPPPTSNAGGNGKGNGNGKTPPGKP